MSTLRNATSNTLLLLAGQLVTWGSTLALSAAYGRYLGPAPFGELYLATTFTALVGFPIEYSFNQQVVRDVAQSPEHAHRYLTGTLALKGLLWVGLYALSIGLAMALGYSGEEQWLIGVCGLMLVSTAISTTLISVQTAYMQVGMAKFGTVIEKGLDVVVATILMRAGAGVQVVALVLLVGSLAGMSWQIMRVVRMIGIKFVWDITIVRRLVRSGLSFLVYGVLGVIYYRVDTVLLSVMGTAAEIGIYGAAYRLLDTLMFVPTIVMGAVMSPILAKFATDTAGNRDKMRTAIEKSTVAMLLCAVPVSLGLLVTAPNIISFIYGSQGFAGSAADLQGLAFGIIALYMNSVLTTILISTGQEHRLPIIAAVALVFNVVVNLILIPRFMGLGAAWATALTEFLLLALSLVMIDRQLIPARLWLPAAKILLAGLVMACVAHLLSGLSILLIIPPAGVTYAVLVAMLRTLPREDMALLGGALSRKVPAPALAFLRAQVAAGNALQLRVMDWLTSRLISRLTAAPLVRRARGWLTAALRQAEDSWQRLAPWASHRVRDAWQRLAPQVRAGSALYSRARASWRNVALQMRQALSRMLLSRQASGWKTVPSAASPVGTRSPGDREREAALAPVGGLPQGDAE